MLASILVAPPDYRVERRHGVVALARPEAVAFVRAALGAERTLFDHAAARPDARRIESGRGPLYVIPTETAGGGPRETAGSGRADAAGRAGVASWIVRHARRGGALARWTRDVYVRVGTPRPFRELLVSEAARRRGIPTPVLVAAAVYPVGGRRYRGDVVTRRIPASADLARIVFGGESAPGAPRPVDAVSPVAAAEAAGRLVRHVHERGLVHPDLNLANVLIGPGPAGEPPLRAWLLDLDGCRLAAETASDGERRRMLKRFERSWRKWERRAGREAPEALAAFRRGYATGAAAAGGGAGPGGAAGSGGAAPGRGAGG